jgi:hypothetical protein
MSFDQSDGRIVDAIDPDDEVTWPVERTDVYVCRTQTETWNGSNPLDTPRPAPRPLRRRKHDLRGR